MWRRARIELTNHIALYHTNFQPSLFVDGHLERPEPPLLLPFLQCSVGLVLTSAENLLMSLCNVHATGNILHLMLCHIKMPWLVAGTLTWLLVMAKFPTITQTFPQPYFRTFARPLLSGDSGN